MKWVVARLGDDDMKFYCHSDTYNDLPNEIYCTGVGSFAFNFKTLRYQHYFEGSYLEQKVDDNSQEGDSEQDTPYIEIGACSKI